MSPPKPTFNVPAGAAAKVSIIDSTLSIDGMNTGYLMGPDMPGFDVFPTIPTWSFLVESSTGKKALFDLGVPPNYESAFTPLIQNKLKNSGFDVKVEAHVADILKEGGVDPGSINGVIWRLVLSIVWVPGYGTILRYWWLSDMMLTQLAIGIGITLVTPQLFPGPQIWSSGLDSRMRSIPATRRYQTAPFMKAASSKPFCLRHPPSSHQATQFKYSHRARGRTLHEIDFTDPQKSLQVGPFRAYDYFSDGSFYLLDTPGHAIGHLAGLARTSSSPDTFIFMGGDLCHHGAEIRPSPHLPLPPTKSLQDFLPLSESLRLRASSCPGSNLFETLNTSRNRPAGGPFFQPTIGLDIPLAIKTIEKAQEADAQDDVFFVFAHDGSIRGVVDMFPAGANEWKAKGWREKTLWAFLRDLMPAVEKA